MKSEIIITNVSDDDFDQIQQIYAHYVENTTISLEETAPSADELKNRYNAHYPYLVAKQKGKVVGYAYAFAYRTRCAYRFTVEESVYISKDFAGQGIGKMLLDELTIRCRAAGFKQMLAVIAGVDNAPSIKFHQKLGFTKCGNLKNFGFKFGKWIDTLLMQKEL